jgi:hypothetical protein
MKGGHTMKTYYRNDAVPEGIYFNARHVCFKSMDEEGRLPAEPDGTWRRVPALALLVVGPLMGLAYAIFLPLIGFAMVGGVVLRWAGELAVEAGHASSRVLRPAWQPARAFLSRGRTRPAGETKAEEKDRWAEDVERELGDDETK